MKIVLWIIAGLVGVAILAVATFLWMIVRTDNRVGAVVKALEKEFSTGVTVVGLPGRAMNLGAGSFDLYVIDPADPAKDVGIASADRTFGSLQPGEKFEVQFERFESKFRETPTGRLILAFPVFMNSRWVLRVQFKNGQVQSTESSYLD